MMMISIVICTYNRSALLANVLSDLNNCAVPSNRHFEIIVVDNNSTDQTPDVVRAVAREARVPIRYVFERTQGLSFARNTGIQAAHGDIIAFTDDDVRVDREWIVELATAFERFNCAAVCGKIMPLWLAVKPGWFYLDRPYSLAGVIVQYDRGDTACVLETPGFGANMAFVRRVFDTYGTFRTDLGRSGNDLGSGEETELFNRLLGGGEPLMYIPGALVYHPVPAERVQKRYIQSWFFANGRAEARTKRCPERAARYFGIPRYLFRMLGEQALEWAITIDRKDRFRRKVRVYHTAGMIAETRRLALSSSGER